MTLEEVKQNNKKWLHEIDQVEESQYFDDLKEVELLESYIQENIFEYCVAKKYEIEGFPFIQFQKIKNQEPGYDEDYLTHERVAYYIDRLAMEKEDIFSLYSQSLQYYFPEISEKEQKEQLQVFIALAEQENVQFDLTEDEIEQINRVEKPYRPKLP